MTQQFHFWVHIPKTFVHRSTVAHVMMPIAPLFHGELEASWVTVIGGWGVGSTVWWVLLWAAMHWLETEDWIYT